MSITYVIEKIKEQVSQAEKNMQDIRDEMSKLDENSEEFVELDFEFNHTAGMLLAYRHCLTIAQKGE